MQSHSILSNADADADANASIFHSIPCHAILLQYALFRSKFDACSSAPLLFSLSRGKQLHTRNRHLRNHCSLQWHFPMAFQPRGSGADAQPAPAPGGPAPGGPAAPLALKAPGALPGALPGEAPGPREPLEPLGPLKPCSPGAPEACPPPLGAGSPRSPRTPEA